MDRKEMLYAFIKEEEYRPMKGKEIAALFCVPKKERAKFHAPILFRRLESVYFRTSIPSKRMVPKVTS